MQVRSSPQEVAKEFIGAKGHSQVQVRNSPELATGDSPEGSSSGLARQAIGAKELLLWSSNWDTKTHRFLDGGRDGDLTLHDESDVFDSAYRKLLTNRDIVAKR